jgi:O-succinylbenzoic acid--CoA ligase
MAHDGLSVRDAVIEPGVAELPAIIDNGRVISFGDLATLVERRAVDLAAYGVGPGSRVALRATCEVGTVVTFFALLELGAAFVPIHPRLTESEEQFILDDVCPDVRLSGPDIERLNTKQVAPIDNNAENPTAIVYTSGTTGRPKGAVLSRAAFVASARASESNLGWSTNDRWLVCMPLAHVGGLSILTRCFSARKPIILEPRFEPESVLRAIRREHATQLSVVPTMLDALIQADHEGDLKRLRFVLVGGAPASPRLLERAANHGLLAITTYGLTEGCSQVTCQPLRAPGTMEAGSGKVLPGIELRITREQGGLASVNEVGFIEVRGPVLMRGYWSGPEKPLMKPWSEDGWFVTGDLGALDETGRLFVHARRTDLIVTGGENVYPAEVEQAFEVCPGVTETVVFGIPDERWGQVVAIAMVVSANGLSEEEVALAAITDVSNRLGSHKRPRRFVVLPSFSRNVTGKVDRAAVCREAESNLRSVPSR